MIIRSRSDQPQSCRTTVSSLVLGVRGLILGLALLAMGWGGAVHAQDTEPPVVTLFSPNGGEMWTGGEIVVPTWTASDNVGVIKVDLFYRVSDTSPWITVAKNQPDIGIFTWYVHNTPTSEASFRLVAQDAAGNQGEDQSDAIFTILQTPGGFVGTTLRDFELPGTQPFGGGNFNNVDFCLICHSGYDSAVEPGHNFKGSMMAHSLRDPIFFASLAVVEQDAPSSGDLCLRCHTPIGWNGGRCNPTDGTLLAPSDRDGVSCSVCHRMVDPFYEAGVSPLEDLDILAGLDPQDLPTSYGQGQFIFDTDFTRWRGPFADAQAQHSFLESPLHRDGMFCGTCHDVSNPVFTRTSRLDQLGGLDAGRANIERMAGKRLQHSSWSLCSRIRR